MTTMRHDAGRPARPLREGLFQLNPPRLLGSRCEACGAASFPARSFCPTCRSEGAQQGAPLSPQGRVFTYTVVHQSPGGRPTPYVLAYVDLEDDVRVLAQLDEPAEQVRIGMPVSFELKQVGIEDGVPIVFYAFVAHPAPAGETR